MIEMIVADILLIVGAFGLGWTYGVRNYKRAVIRRTIAKLDAAADRVDARQRRENADG